MTSLEQLVVECLKLLIGTGILAFVVKAAYGYGALVTKIDGAQLVDSERHEVINVRLQGLHDKMDRVNGSVRDHGNRLSSVEAVCDRVKGMPGGC